MDVALFPFSIVYFLVLVVSLFQTLSDIADMSGEGGHSPPVPLLAPPQPGQPPAPALTRHREQRQDIVIVYY